MNPTIRVVIPCYNEVDRLDTEIFAAFAETDPGVAFVFVDDGSTDGTFAVIKGLQARNPRNFEALRLAENCGKAEAVRQGMNHAFESDCELVGFWDADLATPLPVIRDFAAQFQQQPHLRAVIGSRVKLLGRSVERHRRRHYAGRLFATAAALSLGFPVYDTQCGAKLWRRTAANRALFETSFKSDWVFDVEILARMAVDAEPPPLESVMEFPLLEWRDVPGSKVKLSHLPGTAVDLAAIFWRYRADRSHRTARLRTGQAQHG